jgi:hypothetical protein
MKSRNAVIAMWTALLVAIGLVLALAAAPNAADEDFVVSPPLEPTAGSVAVKPWPEANEVRLVVADLSFEEQAKTGAWTSRPEGVVLTPRQRAIVDESVHLYRMTKKEADHRAYAGCFIPHHFFRYFDKSGRQIGELQICYCCQGIAMEPALRPSDIYDEWQFDFPKVERMLHEMGVSTDINC